MKIKRTATLVLILIIVWFSMDIVQAEASTYKVKPGDTLWKVATSKKVTVNQLVKWNHLKTTKIRVGQVLTINTPQLATKQATTNISYVQYVVKKGDTLYLLAKRFNTTIGAVKTLNKLHSDSILVGQKLSFPNYGSKKESISTTPIPGFLAEGVFPLAKGSYIPFTDTWGESRQFGGSRAHEGTDILAAKGTPIMSAANGVVGNYGWNQLGGWRLSVKTAEGYNLYYAHLSKYATGIKPGAGVKKGQLIGYVGNTGYGPEGTAGKFVSHLHFGIYNSHWVAINPYNHLKFWASIQ
jgi:peptidoglycan LD-endopeptidase LytH